jgi:hypothetical protein
MGKESKHNSSLQVLPPHTHFIKHFPCTRIRPTTLTRGGGIGFHRQEHSRIGAEPAVGFTVARHRTKQAKQNRDRRQWKSRPMAVRTAEPRKPNQQRAMVCGRSSSPDDGHRCKTFAEMMPGAWIKEMNCRTQATKIST